MKLRFISLLMALILAFGSCALAEELPVPTDVPLTEYKPISAEALKRVQQQLISLGILNDKADGIYGPKTEAALKAFQARSGLPQTGLPDPATLNALNLAAADPTSVKDVQQRLIDLGYLNGKADGAFGKLSVAALKQFQWVHGIEANGEMNRETANALFSSEAVRLPEGLSSGNKGGAVLSMQKRLYQLGFQSSEPDEAYGKNTVSAVKSFQQHLVDQGLGDVLGVTVDGKASPIEVYLLQSDTYSSYVRDLNPGDTGSEVLRIETRLYQLGYMDIAADENMDDYTADALELFREKAMIDTDAVADRQTVDALFTEDAPKADHCAPHDIAYGDEGSAVRNVEQALVDGGVITKVPDGKYDKTVEEGLAWLYKYLKEKKNINAPLFADSKALSKEAQQALTGGIFEYTADVGGKKNNTGETKRVQRRLYTLYYLPKKEIDGKYGDVSRKAIKAFQAANGLDETGVADQMTQSVLFSDSAVAKPLPYLVKVSIDRQVVEVYELNAMGEYDLTKSFSCSTGLHNSTPRGIFLEGFPVNRWHYFKKFYCWAQYSFEIVDDIMFHSVIYGSKSEKSLRSSSLRNIGNPASHGCIRLTVEDAKWLFEHCKKGSLAIIIY